MTKYGKTNFPMHNRVLMWEAWTRSHGVLQLVLRAGKSEDGESGGSMLGEHLPQSSSLCIRAFSSPYFNMKSLVFPSQFKKKQKKTKTNKQKNPHTPVFDKIY